MSLAPKNTTPAKTAIPAQTGAEIVATAHEPPAVQACPEKTNGIINNSLLRKLSDCKKVTITSSTKVVLD